jgi:hypothetical protein
MPLSVERATATFAGAPFRWWFAGRHALDLHVEDSWRDHDDLDVGICRVDAPGLRGWLPGWDLAVASQGKLTAWTGEPLANGQKNVWCRRSGTMAWQMDLSVGTEGAASWHFRQDEGVSSPWDLAVLNTASGSPYLAPELQLLFNSQDPQPKDDLDAAVVIPRLDRRRRRALGSLLPSEHPWQILIGEA